MQDSDPRLQRALDTWPLWNVQLSDAPRVIAPLGGGLSNSSWLLAMGDAKCVLRLNNQDHQIWQIDRVAEYKIHRAVEAIGLAPEILHCDLSTGFLVTRYIEGKVLSSRDLTDPVIGIDLAEAIQRFSQLDLNLPAFNYAKHLDRYVAVLRRLGGAVPDILCRTIAAVEPEIKAFQSSDWRPCLVHHDLESRNIIQSDQGLKIIDWEYGAMGYGGMDLAVLGSRYTEPHAVVPALRELINDLWYLIEELASDVAGTDPS